MSGQNFGDKSCPEKTRRRLIMSGKYHVRKKTRRRQIMSGQHFNRSTSKLDHFTRFPTTSLIAPSPVTSPKPTSNLDHFTRQASFPPPRVTRRRLPYMEVKEEWRKWDGQVTGNWTTENCRDVNFSHGGMKSFETWTFRRGRRKVVQTWTGRRGRGELSRCEYSVRSSSWESKFDIGLIAFYESSDRIEELKTCETRKKTGKKKLSRTWKKKN